MAKQQNQKRILQFLVVLSSTKVAGGRTPIHAHADNTMLLYSNMRFDHGSVSHFFSVSAVKLAE
jgi:hypothetical protein